jgi:hypothetical protein
MTPSKGANENQLLMARRTYVLHSAVAMRYTRSKLGHRIGFSLAVTCRFADF